MSLKFRKVKKNASEGGESTLFTKKNMMILGGGVAVIFVIRYLMKKAAPAGAATMPDGTPLTPAQEKRQIAATRVQQEIAAGKMVYVQASGTSPGHWERKSAASPVNGTDADLELLNGVGGIFSSGRGLGIL